MIKARIKVRRIRISLYMLTILLLLGAVMWMLCRLNTTQEAINELMQSRNAKELTEEYAAESVELLAEKEDTLDKDELQDFQVVFLKSYPKYQETNEEGLTKRKKIEKQEGGRYLLVKESWYERNGNLSGIREYEYDENGNKISEKDNWYENGEVDLYEETVYQFDEDGYLVQMNMQSYYNGGEYLFGENEEKYEYDMSGKLIKMLRRSNVTEYKYDENDRLIQEVESDQWGSPQKWIDYDYDSKGNVIIQSLYRGDGGLSEQTQFIYNDRNELIKQLTTDCYGVTYEHSYEYDEYGRNIKTELKEPKTWQEGFIEKLWINKYDEQGKLVETIYSDNAVSYNEIYYEYIYME